MLLISSSQQHYEVSTVMTFIFRMRRRKFRKLMSLMKFTLIAQLETKSVVSHSPNPCFTICTQPHFPFFIWVYHEQYSWLSAIIRVVYYFTKETDQRNQEQWKEGEKEGGTKRVLLGKSSTKKPGTAVLLSCTVHTNRQMFVNMQIITW